MVKLVPVIGALLSTLSLVLLAVGSATNKWVVLDHASARLNPPVTNSKPAEEQITVLTSKSDITYNVANFGLWIGCHKEHKGAVSCSYIGLQCYSNVCWIRKTDLTSTKTCLDSRLKCIVNCTAYQVVRAFIVVGIVVLVLGVVTQLVSLTTLNRSLAMLAGLAIFVAGLFVMIGFAVFYNEQFSESGLNHIGHIGFSFNLVTASWPIALVAGFISCCSASMGLRHKEVSDYSASNY